MSSEQKISDLIEAPLNGLGYELVRVKLTGKDMLQILIDTENGVSIDECAKATKLIRNILHVAELDSLYALEVSSPGLDRPLLKAEHFIKFLGSDVKIMSNNLIDGQKKFIGKLTEFNKDTQQVTLTCEDKIIVIALNQMQSANLYYK